MIKISVPNDDHVALHAMAKALEEIAVARGAPAASGKQIGELNYKINIDTTGATAALEELVKQAEVDTTSQQVESLNVDKVLQEYGYQRQDPAPSSVTITTDSTGTPWHERIHSASKALNADGTWRLRRKPKDMDEGEWSDYVDMIKADLQYPVECGGQEPDDKQKLIDETVAKLDALYESEPTITPEGDDFHVDTGVVTEQQVADIPPPPPVPVPDLPVTTAEASYGHEHAHMTFPQVMAFLTERHGRITSAQVDQIIADMGLESIMDLNTQPEHIGPFIARVKALLGE